MQSKGKGGGREQQGLGEDVEGEQRVQEDRQGTEVAVGRYKQRAKYLNSPQHLPPHSSRGELKMTLQ